MNFRKSISYNLNDSKYEKVGSRVVVHHDVEWRCETVLAILCETNAPLSLTNIVTVLKGRGMKYKPRDLSYALAKLASEDLIICKGDTYIAVAGARKAWKKVARNYV